MCEKEQNEIYAIPLYKFKSAHVQYNIMNLPFTCLNKHGEDEMKVTCYL